MIEFKNVTKSFTTRNGSKTVLDNVSFIIERGRSIGICGPNGSGKSTLTRLIAGIEFPSAGTIRRDMSISWPLGFGGAFQGSLTGADNCRFIARIYDKPVDWVMDFVNDFAELGDYFKMPVKTYSAGMNARLAFAVSLAIEFDCYLIDEITAVGDSSFREKCRVALEERRRKGTLVMVSHEPSILREHCDTGAILFQGRLTFQKTIDETIHAYHQLFI